MADDLKKVQIGDKAADFSGCTTYNNWFTRTIARILGRSFVTVRVGSTDFNVNLYELAKKIHGEIAAPLDLSKVERDIKELTLSCHTPLTKQVLEIYATNLIRNRNVQSDDVMKNIITIVAKKALDTSEDRVTVECIIRYVKAHPRGDLTQGVKRLSPKINAIIAQDEATKVLQYLPSADIIDGKRAGAIFCLWNTIHTKLRRWIGGASQYDETKAKALLLDYINKPEVKQALSPQHATIMKIYDRLSHLAKEKGTWADGVDIELLAPLKIDEAEKLDPLLSIKKMILEEVFVPDAPEEQVFIPKKPVVAKEDPKAKSYSFTHLTGLRAPTQRQLFHIQADEFGSSSELEGGQSKDMVYYLHSFLHKTNRDPRLVEELASARFSDDMGVNDIANAFRTKKPLLIAGGWTGKPFGHAIYYEIIPESATTATFRLFNTGAGVGYHKEAIAGHKKKYQSHTDWKGIDRAKLESPFFLEALKELKTAENVPGSYGTSPEFGEKDVYQGLRALLAPKAETAEGEKEVEPRFLQAPQRSGICPWRSLMAFMRTKMELNEYKRFKCDIKLQSLVDYVRSRDYNTTQDEWRLVKKSHQNLTRAIVSLYQKKGVGDRYIEQAEAALQPVKAWIRENSRVRYKRRESYFRPEYKPPEKNVDMFSNPAFSQSLDSMRQDVQGELTIQQPSGQIVEMVQKLDLTRSPTIASTLESVAKAFDQAWLKGDDLALYTAVTDLVKRLSIDKAFWQQSVKDKEQLVVAFGQIAKNFTKSLFTIPNAKIIYPEKVYVLQKLLYLQGIFAKEVGKSWSELEVTISQEDLFLTFPDAAMQKDLEVIKSGYRYFNRLHIDSYELGHSVGPLYDEKAIGVELAFSKGAPDRKKALFQDTLREESPEVIKKIAERVPNFKHLPKFEQDAHIFASDALPEWIKAIRDTQLALHHLIKADTGPLARLDRRTGITPVFKVKAKPEEAVVTITLEGVDKTTLDVEKKTFVHYASHYRKITEGPMRSFLKYIHGSRIKIEEKRLANITAKEARVDMKDEEFRELARIRSEKKLQHIELLEYFTKHPEKLQDPDYQTFFHVLLFDTGLLAESVKIEGFEKQLSRFIQKNYEQFIQENQLQPAVFLLKIACELKSFCPKVPFFNDTLIKIKGLLEQKGLETDEKMIIYGALASELSKKDSLTDEEVVKLVTANVFIEENEQASKSPIDPDTRNDGRKAILRHAARIKSALQDQNLLNEIFKTLRPKLKAPKKWIAEEKRGEFPHYKAPDGSVALYPLVGKLLTKGAETRLPVTITENPLFSKLFKGIEYAVLNPGNVYSFKDANGVETLVCQKEDKFVVEQLVDNEWLRYVPSSMLLRNDKSTINSSYLIEQYEHWHTVDPVEESSYVLYAINPKSKEKEYVIQFDSQGPWTAWCHPQEVIRLKDDLMLGKPSELLTSFEKKEYIHELYEDGKVLKKIALPRFSLSFTPAAQDPKILMCDQFPGYFLNMKDSVKSLGVHKHYLLLENASHHKKLLLPQAPLTSPPLLTPKEVLKPLYQLYQKDATQKFYTFDVTKKSKLFSKSREANLYLAEVLACAQEYKLAAEFLKKYGSKLSRYTEKEDKILEALSKLTEITGDKSGNGTLLQLYASFLRVENMLSNHLEPDYFHLQELEKLYNRYISSFRSNTLFRLQPQEELLLLRTFLSQRFNPIQFLRLQELDPRAAQKIRVPDFASREELLPRTLKGFTFPFSGYYVSPDQLEKPKLEPLLTRYKSALSKHFLYYYDVARKGPEKGPEEERERLKASLAFLGIQNPQTAHFFEAVLHNPSAFPEFPPGEKSYDDRKKWKKEVVARAEIELANLAEEPQVTKPKAALKTAEFQLEEKKEVKERVTLKPKIRPLAALADAAKSKFQATPQEKSKKIAELPALLHACKDDDPVQNQEVSRLLNDVEVHKKSPPVLRYSTNKLTDVKELLAKDKESDAEALKGLEEEILLLANKQPASFAERALLQLKKWAGLRRAITLDELIVSFARNEYRDILEQNPLLSKKELELISEKVGQYLLVATRNQQRLRAENLIDKPELVNQLAETLLAKRSYDPEKHPAYLVFEYYSDILMRPTQVEKLEKFLEGGEQNLVMEMIMGSGKSKVLLPLLGLLRADGKTLSMLIVPQPLFESVTHDTQAILQSFSHSLHSIHFDRHTKCTEARLQIILDELKATIERKECLIMTSKSVQCLILKFIEESKKHITHFPVELELLQKILRTLADCGYPIIDEADTVLNVLHEVSFSGGKRLAPDGYELTLLSELFSMVYDDPEIKKLARIESDPQANMQAPVLTEKLYTEKLQLLLANRFIDRLGSMRFESEALNEQVQNFTKNLTAKDKETFVRYLCRSDEQKKEQQIFFDSLDEEVQDIVSLAAEEISHLLPYTLTRICDEKYGLDELSKSPLAIPYLASLVPNRGSQFANPYITMNYTFQTYMKKGVTKEIVEGQLVLLQEQAMREIAASGGKLIISETKAGKAFQALKGDLAIPLTKYKPVHIAQLTDLINQSSQKKRLFITTIVLPQLELFELKMSCNPHNLVAFFLKAVAGFTGTLWNGASMHHTLKPEPEAGTDAKTLSLLWEHSRATSVQIKEGTMQEMLGELQKKKIIFDMISDAGGYFREGTNSLMAHQIAKSFGKEVVFYNDKGEQSITDGDQELPLSQSTKQADERLTFLDQSHTTGADVPQKQDAVSLVTIGRNMLLRDLLQAVWRLRGLEKQQRVRFLLSEEVAGIIRQKLNLPKEHKIELDTILKFVISNQASQQGRDNYKALKEEFAGIQQMILLKVLLAERLTPEARVQAFAFLEETWIKPARYRPRELYGNVTNEIEAEKVVEADKKACSAKLKGLFTKLPWLEKVGIHEKELLDEIELIASRMKGKLPPKLQVPSKDIEDDETVEVEKELKDELEQETELETQEQAQKEKVRMHMMQGDKFKECESFKEAADMLQKSTSIRSDESLITHNLTHVPLYPLNSFLAQDPLLKAYETAFSGIQACLNVLEWTDKEGEYQLLGSRRTDFHHLLVQGLKVTLLTQEEARDHRGSPDYFNLTLGYNDPDKEVSKDLRFKVAKLKFLNGETQFSDEELDLLRLWFQNQGVEKMKKLYQDHIIKIYPGKRARYKTSPLRGLLAAA